ncbi:MAG TPA: glycoside hydrolase family 27 protein [Bryobacteraceae bacterium]|jgi:alpha-galactosidase
MKRSLVALLCAVCAPIVYAADLTGHWMAKFEADGATRETSLYLKAEGDLLTGYMFSNQGNEAIHNGKINGDSVSFIILRDRFGEEQKLEFTGKVTGETLTLEPPHPSDRPARHIELKRVSAESPGPMPAPPPKISLPTAEPVPYNGLAKTPPMGWNSWNKFANKVTDQLIRETADAMVKNGMKDAGYVYINIDDTWEGARDAQGNIQTNGKFPNMKALADYVHSKGLKLGIYSSPGPKTCAGYEGSFQHEKQDARTYAAWGIDYLKYDWCSASQVYDYHSMPAVYAKMGAALAATGRSIVYSLCQYGVLNVQDWGRSVDGNLWRTTGDIRDTWNSMLHIGFDLQLNLVDSTGPGHWNDPDMLEVGNGGMTTTEYRTHMSLWSLLAAPLLAGNDLRSVSTDVMEILTNKEVIAVDQDPLGKQARRVAKNGDTEIWSRPLQDGSYAVGLFNRGEASAKVTSRWSDVGLSGTGKVRDLWTHTNLGSVPNEYSADVAPHGGVLIRVEPEKESRPSN